MHYGVRDTANFNWRFLFDVAQPTKHTKLLMQVWDTRNTSANDSLAEVNLQLRTLFENVEKRQHEVHEITLHAHASERSLSPSPSPPPYLHPTRARCTRSRVRCTPVCTRRTRACRRSSSSRSR